MDEPANTHEAMLIGLLNEVLRELSEHFTSIQILATFDEEEEEISHFVTRGKGNWYARCGMAREFLSRDQAAILAKEFGEVLEMVEISGPEEDDDV